MSGSKAGFRGTPMQRFSRKIVAGERGCVLWDGAKGPRGYGRIFVEGRIVPAHRFAYEMLVGDVPDGLELDHLCRVPSCVNPAHLEAVTHRENVRRGTAGQIARVANLSRVECLKGHPYSVENTYLTPAGHRACRTCHGEAAARYRERTRS